MESTAVNVREEDTVRVVVAADATVAAIDVSNPIAVSDANVPPIKVEKTIIITTDDVEHVVSKLAVASNATATTVNVTKYNPGVEEDQLNIAMASTAISTNEVDEIKHNLGEKVVDEQQRFRVNVAGDESSSQHGVEGRDGDEDYAERTKYVSYN